MAGRLWSIMIVASKSGGPAQFVPDIPNPVLQAQPNDLICWNNQTSIPHQPTIDGVSPELEVIEPSRSSATSYQIPTTAQPGTLNYHCALHPEETGSIEVIQ